MTCSDPPQLPAGPFRPPLLSTVSSAAEPTPARAEARGETPDYAKCLHEAQRFIRKQEKWKSPYYWALFVLVGPN